MSESASDRPGSKTARRLNAQAAARKRWSRTPLAERSAQTQAARDGRRAALAREIDPEGKLPEAELARLVSEAQTAHMARMTAAAARARAARRPA